MSTAEWRREGAQGRKKGRKKAIRVISGNEDNGVGGRLHFDSIYTRNELKIIKKKEKKIFPDHLLII